MDSRGYGSGYSSWGGGGGGASSRGSGGYDLYGYKDSMSSGGGYGGGYGGGGQMKRGLSGGSLLSTGTSADAVIAKINQRLDMLTQLEGSGSMKGGGRSERFDQYESFDSRPSSLTPRDLYRSGSYGYSEGPADLLAQRGGAGYGGGGGGGGVGGGYDGSSSFGSAKPHLVRQPRDSYSGPAWAGRRSPRRGGAMGPGGRGFGRRPEPPMGGGMGGARGGHSPGGRGRLPSLLSHRMYPETGAYQQPPGPQDPLGARHFGGRQRGRKRPVNRVKPQRDGQKKRKQTLTGADEPESKMGKTETESAEPANGNEAAQPSGETAEGKSPAPQAGKAPAEGGDALTMQEEIDQMKQKLQGKQPPPQDKFPKLRKRRGFLERSGVKLNTQRVMFACSICKFRSFYDDEMAAHMESRFHKEHFKFLSNQLSKPTTDFLEEYLNNKYRKTVQRTKQMENISAAICQVYKEQDLTRDIGMEHFMKKVEAAHCAACDLFIPMQHHLIQRHLRSPDHNFNRKGMMEQSKRSSLSVARSILNHKVIGKKLESYLKGENPFSGNEQDPEDSMVMEVSEAELAGQGQAQEDGEGAGGDAGQATGQDGAEEKMEEEEELEGVLGEDGLEGEEEGCDSPPPGFCCDRGLGYADRLFLIHCRCTGSSLLRERPEDDEL
ncbi:A-kinase anchor protein 8-like [Megalops cyprinoides]|uniref:A-kinase anchor protein 8-like n=1 Tax=Megalops cyprinoides TaxID=118141 RepID=UPI001864176A|nr:A-kinase anchor protein 8-like [Megalops cyprinoides]